MAPIVRTSIKLAVYRLQPPMSVVEMAGTSSSVMPPSACVAIRLQNVLQDAAGKFDSATGSSASFAGSVETVANAVDRLSNSKILAWLGRLNNQLESSGFLQLSSTLREVEAILQFLDRSAVAVAGSFDGLANNVEDAVSAALGFDDAAAAPEALRVEIEMLSASVVSGQTDAANLRAELVRLGASPLNLGIQIGQIMDLARAAMAAAASIAAARGAAAAAIPVWDQQKNEDRSTRARAGDANTPYPDQANLPPAPNRPPNLLDYDPSGGGGSGSGSGGGGGSGGASKAETYAEALKDQQRRIDELNRETAAQAALNPLIDDYG